MIDPPNTPSETVSPPVPRLRAALPVPNQPPRTSARRIAKPSLGRILQATLKNAPAAFAEGGARWSLLLPIALALGIGGYFSLKAEPPVWLAWAAIGLTAPLALWVRRRGLAPLGWLALAVAIGFGAAQTRTLSVGTVQADRAGWAYVEGRVTAVEARPRDHRITLTEISLSDTRLQTTPSGVRLTVRGVTEPPGIGDRIGVRARLGPPSPPIAPDAFDFQRHAYFQGIGAVGFIAGPIEVLEPGASAGGFRTGIDRVRAAVSARVRSSLEGERGAIAAALLTGDRSGIPEPVLEVLRLTGLAHLLAISGLHMALVVGTVLICVRFGLSLIPGFALRYPTKKIAAGIALAAATAYLMLAGAPIPTQRAYLMIGLVLVAVLLDREALSLRTVALAAVVVLLPFPESLLGPSFQMSFAAVAALIVFYDAVRRRMGVGGMGAGEQSGGAGIMPGPARTLGRYVLGVLATSVVASMATAPIAAHHFQMVPLSGGVANLLAVPVTAFVTMPAGVLAMVGLPFGLEALPLWAMGAGIDATIWSASVASDLPFANMMPPPLPTWGLAALGVGAVWAAVWRGGFRWLGLAPAALALMLWSGVRAPDVVISAKGDLVGVRIGDLGWAVSDTRRNGFVREGWQRRWGGEAGVDFARADGFGADGLGADETGTNENSHFPRFAPETDRLRCDGMGCVRDVHGFVIALAHDQEAALEDCGRADVLIATIPLRLTCEGPVHIIDINDMRELGAHAIWAEEGGVVVRTARGVRGARPWVVGGNR